MAKTVPLSLPLVSPLSPPFLFGMQFQELYFSKWSLSMSSGWVAIVHAWKLNDSAPKNTKMEASGHYFPSLFPFSTGTGTTLPLLYYPYLKQVQGPIHVQEEWESREASFTVVHPYKRMSYISSKNTFPLLGRSHSSKILLLYLMCSQPQRKLMFDGFQLSKIHKQISQTSG